jgi:hypothetical protein
MPARGWTRLRRPEAKLEDEDEDAEDAIDDERLPAKWGGTDRLGRPMQMIPSGR